MRLTIFFAWLSTIVSQCASASSRIIVKDTKTLGPQNSPNVRNVSRDGGYSALINGKIVFFYDDTECFDSEGTQLSFVSNTAAYANPRNDVHDVNDFGVVNLGRDKDGSSKTAILADSSVETGGWIRFAADELQFNEEKKGQERVAIWPGTSPTSINTIQAFFFAPLVYVDSKPQDPSKEYSARGMTLVIVTAPDSGPVATRRGDLTIPGTEVAFGGFSTLIGRKSTKDSSDRDRNDLDVYLFGMSEIGLQLARVGINEIESWDKYKFWDPQEYTFSKNAPKLNSKDPLLAYMTGTFSSGSIFYSPYLDTFLMVYFNKMTDSTFYIRYLDLEQPLQDDETWIKQGKNGKGIEAEDVEALASYKWSDEQALYASKPGPGGFNYAGIAHPEYFNRQYFASSLYPEGTLTKYQRNNWYGSTIVSEKQAGKDGKYLLLSWTSQRGNGIYNVELAVVELSDTAEQNETTSSEGNTPEFSLGNSQKGAAYRLLFSGGWRFLLPLATVFFHFHIERRGVWFI